MRLDAWHLKVVRSGWKYRLMRRLHIAAITLPWGVVYMLGEFDGHEALWRHEQEHMRQVERDGAWRFSVRYLWQLLTVGYWAIDYEIDAYAVSGPIMLLPRGEG